MPRILPARRAAALLAALLLLQLLWPQAAGAFSYFAPTPRGTIGISRPLIQQVLRLEPGERIELVRMWIGGVEVEPQWDQAGLIQYQPPTALPPGDYSVRIHVEVTPGNDRFYYEPLVTDFVITVDRGAIERLPLPGPEELRALERVNHYRRAAGLSELVYSDALAAAARAQARYLTANPSQITVDAHRQAAFNPFFIGEGPGDRARYFQYTDGVFEVINFVDRAEDAVDGWMETLYHRIPLLQPGMQEAGYGLASRSGLLVNAMLTGPANEVTRLVPWPHAGQTDVPTSWDGAEDPDPFRLYPDAAMPVGYPITLSFGGSPRSLSLRSALLIGPEGLVPTMAFHPGNDRHLWDSVAIIPRSPLKPGSTYTVRMSGEVDYGDGRRSYSHEWSFTTAKEHRPIFDRARVLAESPGVEGRRVVLDGTGFSTGLTLYLAGLPVEDLRVESESSLSFRIPRGYTTGPADLLAVTSGGWESLWPRFLTGQEALRLPDRGPAFTSMPVFVHGRPLTASALRSEAGVLLLPEQALLELGARPHSVPEIGRQYWSSLSRTADYTVGRVSAVLGGNAVVTALPSHRHNNVLYVDGAVVSYLAADSMLIQPGGIHLGLRDLGEHWARREIIDLWQAGIVSGMGDGTFQPDQGLTRAAFLKMVVGSLGLQPQPGTGGFADLEGHWADQQGFAAPAVAAGILVPGEYEGGLFEPDRPISREEMAVMVTRALGLEAVAQARLLSPVDGEVTLAARRFVDAQSWTRPGHVAAAVERGIITGYAEDGGRFTFQPTRSATRAEAVVMITRMQGQLARPGRS